jgi:hypothetical protein
MSRAAGLDLETEQPESENHAFMARLESSMNRTAPFSAPERKAVHLGRSGLHRRRAPQGGSHIGHRPDDAYRKMKVLTAKQLVFELSFPRRAKRRYRTANHD